MTTKHHDIQIDVETTYIAQQSSPQDSRYVFAYTITIANTGTVSARLVSRHWIITDAKGHIQEVRGEGVVGEQPRLAPGESFTYTSGAMLETEVGTMHGSYQMTADDGTSFDAPIAAFRLSVPNVLH
ncbi:MAG: Co2+/Mg2+ efflux protein ApaG [Gammaproteobacteria bacterium]|jgi:ApaG protein